MRVLTIAAAASLLAACGSDASMPAPPSPTHTPSLATTKTVVLPDGYRALLPTVQKTGDATLPAFTPRSKGYTLFLRCDGEGSVTVQYNDERGPDVWPCDGALNRSKVYVDKGRQELHVHAAKTTAWSAGIVDGLA